MTAIGPGTHSPEFRLTYATMFDPPEALHRQFDAALERLRPQWGRSLATWRGRPAPGRAPTHWLEVRSPIDRDWLLARLPLSSPVDVARAIEVGQLAQPGWAATPWTDRLQILRRAADLIEQRVYDLAAVVALEVGKNRMESIGEAQETADLLRWYADRLEEADGFDRALPDDPLPGYRSRNRTRLRPYGVWAVIAPFNFPLALGGAPIAAALATGNTVVFKGATETAWSGWLLMSVFRDAGVPDGVLGHLVGGADIGETLVRDPRIAGVTFTGSRRVGMTIARQFIAGPYARPCIAEMGGKNAVIVSRHADIERAATGVARSAFGLTGQKCSAASRVYVERPAACALRDALVARAEAIAVGDPTRREIWMGPVVRTESVGRYRRVADHLRSSGRIDSGGRLLADGDLARGFFVAPTVARIGLDDRLWQDELFAPIVLLASVDSVDEAIARANGSPYGLTAGFYGAPDEIPQFLDQIEAGVTYVNRPQGATTGAWPGYQPFGGWKGSGTTGKGIGSYWYLPLYMREQSQTIVD
ncbi:MAG: aldehyde dehydrogenase family protein [Burkholderiaceae bacterium]